MQHFTSDAARLLGGPGWLEERRIAAVEEALEVELPTTSEEVWRYSLVDDLELDDWEPVAPGTGATGDGRSNAVLASFGDTAATVVVHNGQVTSVELSDAARDAGVTVGRLLDEPEERARALLEATELGEAEHPDRLDLLHRAFSADPVLVSIPRGVRLADPVVVLDWIDLAGAAVFDHLLIEVGEDASVDVVQWEGSDDVAALAVARTDVVLAPAANLRLDVVQDRGEQVWQFARQGSRVEGSATFGSTAAGIGGEYARLRTDCRLVGRGASGNLHAAYLGERAQTLDFRTFQEHEAPDTTSNLLYLGALGGESRSIYTGNIHVHKDARGTNAFQTNRNVKLSDGAWAESVPNLEIENNDVHCSHASTVGPIDPDQRFYLESRGVRPEVAERLIVGGFFDDVLERFANRTVAALVSESLRSRLARIDLVSDAEAGAPAATGAGGAR